MTPREFLDEVREALDSTSWSKAVLCARRRDAALVSQEGESYRFDVMMEDPGLVEVELDLEHCDWSCTCQGPEAVCAHVAAAALALYQNRGKRKPSGEPASTEVARAHVGYRFSSSGSTWKLEAVLVTPGPPPAEAPLHDPLPRELHLTPADRDALALIESGSFRHRTGRLLWALSRCADVTLDGMAVRVSTQEVPLVLVVEEHPRGLRARLSTRERCHCRFEHPAALAVVGSPPALAPLTQPRMPRALRDLYEAGRLIPHQGIGRFLSEDVPELRRYVEVDLRTRRLPVLRDARPYARMTISPARDGFDVLATVAYGDPPLAVVVGDRLILLDGARGVPQRDFRQEQRAARHVEALLDIPAGRRLELRDLEAARFASEVLPRFRGKISGREHAERFLAADRKLQPRWVAGPSPQDPVLVFALPPETPPPPPGKAAHSIEAQPPQPTPPLLDPIPTSAAQELDHLLTQRPHATAQEVLDAWRQGRRLVRLEGGGFARLPSDWMDRYGALLEAMLESSSSEDKRRPGPARTQLLTAADYDPDVEQIRQAILENARVRPISPPVGLEATLRPYQLEGVSWLAHLERLGMGGILADDMGLGKTIQTLALCLLDPPGTAPTLVVAPTSVLDVWRAEAAKKAPALRVRIYHGPGRSLDNLDRTHLVVTSYAVLRRDQTRLSSVSWHRVVLDEAGAIKNPRSQTSRAVRGLRSERRLALTGTPVENRLEELWSLLDFLNPGTLGSLQRFEERFVRPIREGRPDAVERLRIRVKPFILRRIKRDVEQDLPPKTEMVIKPRLSKQELEVYEAVRRSGRVDVRRVLARRGVRAGKVDILHVLLRLRQACCHPALVPGSGIPASFASSKITVLMNHLESLKGEGHKALVFSQWTSYLDILEVALRKRGIAWVRLDGSTRDRHGAVSRFQDSNGPGVFLISLKAGGTGLNLTAADYVFHMDAWWNPAVEDQATDRAYRIGQTRPVVVVRLITAGTVEERVAALQQRKRAVADAALGGADGWLASLDENEIEELLSPVD